ncbi:Filamentation induced by cAMP/death on curing-related protein [Metarhizium album ARSEF 1941]|uniref:Filamentation induced by cAMP/death on curing-related protein n=1 Tax=Metarhizium album (strain ARSEF 1941) TaxID=1081103 RepID=A0A0B2WPT3_METAS|nr:Filamentation induced by cAMP/death on curing-related protein [Metarhizium album ARSEF 1941]KHN96028.1 Filamentation induced by cAMP/death on curing-related protein [Metarhizium album ARSEF 1941]
MKHNLRNTISRGWPSASQRQGDVFMTISADDVYRQVGAVQHPQQLFEKAKSWMTSIQDMERDEVKDELILAELHGAMIRAIFGSELSERDPTYQSQLLELYSKQSGLKNMPAKYILRSRNEVVQHARAFQHIIHAFVVDKKDLSEDLIKETHRILVKGVPIVEEGYPDVSPDEYGGVYRKVVVGAGTTNFTVPEFVPKKMEEMCDALKDELEIAEDRKGIDPFSIASKYSMEFVMIHPFQDGNGRMCRMILNAILCRYAGVIVPIGEQDEERRVYMGIKRRASQEMEGHGDANPDDLRRLHVTFCYKDQDQLNRDVHVACHCYVTDEVSLEFIEATEAAGKPDSSMKNEKAAVVWPGMADLWAAPEIGYGHLPGADG